MDAAETDRAAGLSLARFDLRALGVGATVLAGLAVLSAGSLWYQTWSLGPPSSLWVDTFSDWFGQLAPLFAGLGVWLWWFARRIARRYGLRVWLAHVACVACLAASSVWAVWVAELLTGRFDVL